jgi:hypothetical protein
VKASLAAVALLMSACVAGDLADATSTSATGDHADATSTSATGVVTVPSFATSNTSSASTITLEPSVTSPGERAVGEGQQFVDSTDAYGLIDPLVGMHGHAAAWADVDGDGAVDLVVGTFADRPPDVYRERGATGPSADRLLLNGPDGFDASADLGRGRTSGAVFADLDGDFDSDLVLSRNVKDVDDGGDRTMVFENVDGSLVPRPGPTPFAELGGRTVGVFDEDGDGLLDLFVVEDRYAGGSSRLFRNEGAFVFVDVTEDRGLPSDLEGLGVATVDLDGDHRSDLFVSGSNRLFAGVEGGFEEVDSSVFAWRTFGDEDLVAGVATGDLDRDGRLDLVVGHHFNSTIDFGTEVPVRVYLNRSEPGEFSFLDVTDVVGMVGLPTKAPHVQVVDLDNDGWPDILTSASAEDGAVPAVFEHRGLSAGFPQFAAPTGLGSPQYWVTAPTADFDRDFRLDVIAVEWEPSLPTLLLRNTREVGNAIRVEVRGPRAVGAAVTVYDGSNGELIGYQEIVASVGYTAGIETMAHFGIGDRTAVDVVVRLPDGTLHTLDGVPANSVVDLDR